MQFSKHAFALIGMVLLAPGCNDGGSSSKRSIDAAKASVSLAPADPNAIPANSSSVILDVARRREDNAALISAQYTSIIVHVREVVFVNADGSDLSPV